MPSAHALCGYDDRAQGSDIGPSPDGHRNCNAYFELLGKAEHMPHTKTMPSWISILAMLSLGLANMQPGGAGPHDLASATSSPRFIDQVAATATYVGAGIFDDRDAAWMYSGSWVLRSQTGAYNTTLHVSNLNGSK